MICCMRCKLIIIDSLDHNFMSHTETHKNAHTSNSPYFRTYKQNKLRLVFWRAGLLLLYFLMPLTIHKQKHWFSDTEITHALMQKQSKRTEFRYLCTINLFIIKSLRAPSNASIKNSNSNSLDWLFWLEWNRLIRNYELCVE